VNRRSFLSNSSLAIGTFLVPDLSIAQADKVELQEKATIPTVDTSMKYNPDGSIRPFKGNTVICHLQPQGKVRDAVDAIRKDLAQASFAAKVALTPPVSYHMTVYPGANDQGRELTGWPTDLSPDASIEECNRVVAERARHFHLGCDLPLRMKVDAAKTVANPRATTLRMISSSPSEEAKIRSIRDRLVDVFGFRDKSHDTYGFHITLAYQLKPFTPGEQEEHKRIMAKHVSLIEAAGPLFEFGNPEFCSFSDMNQFDIQVLLST
jgi:hypothetical protein